MQLQTLKLITIVAEEVLKEQLIHKVQELGATGCSYHPTQGTGSRSARHDDVFGENFQMKIVCPQDVADKILTHISRHYFEKYAIVTWVMDVDVVRGSQYIKKSG
jgi:nitrogen regulatory protein P-II 2